MADSNQVQQQDFYEQFVDVTLAVCCTHRPQDYQYKKAVRQIVINPRAAHSQIQRQFDVALPQIEAELADGREVAVHCEKTFHRAIAVTGAVMKAVSGVEPQVY